MRTFLTGFKQGFQYFGHNISIIVNTILLSIVYLLAVGLTAIVAKITGKHFLELKINKNQNSYWSDLNLKKRPLKDYYRQF